MGTDIDGARVGVATRLVEVAETPASRLPDEVLTKPDAPKTTESDRQRLSGGGLVPKALQARIAAFRKNGIGMPLTELPELLTELSGLTQAQLQEIRRVAIREPTTHPGYKIMARREAIKDPRLKPWHIVQILSGEVLNLVDAVPKDEKAFDKRIMDRLKERGALKRERGELSKSKDDVADRLEEIAGRLATIDSEIPVLRELRARVRGVDDPRVPTFDDVWRERLTSFAAHGTGILLTDVPALDSDLSTLSAKQLRSLAEDLGLPGVESRADFLRKLADATGHADWPTSPDEAYPKLFERARSGVDQGELNELCVRFLEVRQGYGQFPESYRAAFDQLFEAMTSGFGEIDLTWDALDPKAAGVVGDADAQALVDRLEKLRTKAEAVEMPKLTGDLAADLGALNDARKPLVRLSGKLTIEAAKIIDGRAPDELYPQERAMITWIENTQRNIDKKTGPLMAAAAATYGLKEKGFFDDLGCHFGIGLSAGLSGMGSVGVDPMFVAPVPDEGGLRNAKSEFVFRGGGLAFWGRYTPGQGIGAGPYYGYLYGGQDAMVGRWAGGFYQGIGGLGVAGHEGDDRASVVFQLTIPVWPLLRFPVIPGEPYAGFDIDLFLDHPLMKHAFVPVNAVVGAGVFLLKPVLWPVHKGGELVSAGLKKRRAWNRAKKWGPPPAPPLATSGAPSPI